MGPRAARTLLHSDPAVATPAPDSPAPLDAGQSDASSDGGPPNDAEAPDASPDAAPPVEAGTPDASSLAWACSGITITTTLSGQVPTRR